MDETVKMGEFWRRSSYYKSRYQLDELKKLICEIRRKYNVRVYLEPGEAIALNAGYLVTEVMGYRTQWNGYPDSGCIGGMPHAGCA